MKCYCGHHKREHGFITVRRKFPDTIGWQEWENGPCVRCDCQRYKRKR